MKKLCRLYTIGMVVSAIGYSYALAVTRRRDPHAYRELRRLAPVYVGCWPASVYGVYLYYRGPRRFYRT